MNKENIVLSNIIGLNPTGTMSYNGTIKMNGNNNILNTPGTVNKKNINKIQNNELLCNNIENFENDENNIQNKLVKNKKKYLFIIIFIYLIIFIFLIIFL
jgi:hypothetical protein